MMYTEIVRLKGSTYIPSPETPAQLRKILERLSRLNDEIPYVHGKELGDVKRDELLDLAMAHEEIRACAMALKRFSDGRLNGILKYLKNEGP